MRSFRPAVLLLLSGCSVEQLDTIEAWLDPDVVRESLTPATTTFGPRAIEAVEAGVNADLRRWLPDAATASFYAQAPGLPRARLDPTGLTLQTGFPGLGDQEIRLLRGVSRDETTLGTHTVTIGRGRVLGLATSSSAPRAGACQLDGARGADGACLPRVELPGVGFVEWWESREAGLEQGWTIDAPPSAGNLVITVPISAASVRQVGAELRIRDGSGRLDVYGQQRAWDADHRALPVELRWEADAGQARLEVHTAGARWPVTVDPLYTASSDAEPPLSLDGEGEDDFFGASLAAPGDVNNDGYPDLVVGAPGYDSGAGRVYVYHGSSSGLNTTTPTELDSEEENSFYGWAIAGVGDVNNDGIADFVVGAPFADYGGDNNAGDVYVHKGNSSKSYSFTLIQADDGYDYMGYSVAGAGDVNGDGYNDVLMGAPGRDDGGDDDTSGTDEGNAYVSLGGSSMSSLIELRTLSGLSDDDYGQMGFSIAGIGDINNDGYDDVAMGGPTDDQGAGGVGYNSDTDCPYDCGMFYVFKGSSSVTTGYTWRYSWQFAGESSENLGTSIVPLGNVNNDSYDDFAVGATYDGGTSAVGRVYIYKGRGSSTAPNKSYIITGEDNDDLFGWRLSSAWWGEGASNLEESDTDGDGTPDLAVAIPGNSPGYACVVELPSSLSSSTATTTNTINYSTDTDRCVQATVLDEEIEPASSDDAQYTGSHVVLMPRSSQSVSSSTIDADLAVGQAHETATSHGEVTIYTSYVDADGDGYAEGTDCDDNDASITTVIVYCPDGDGDGHGDEDDIDDDDCTATSSSYREETGSYECDDCDDAESSVNPDEDEVCDDFNVDEDCNGLSDDDDGGLSAVSSTWYPDEDGDGQGDETYSGVLQCDEPSSTVVSAWVQGDDSDCNDDDNTVMSDTSSSTVTELCDGKRNRCDDVSGSSWSASDVPDDEMDNDGDYFVACEFHQSGEEDVAWTSNSSWYGPGSPSRGEPYEGEDCDDTDSSVLDSVVYYADEDGDDYQSATDTDEDDCDAASGYEEVILGVDCDDNDGSIGDTVSWWTDSDGDGYGTGTADTDDCYSDVTNGVDNDDDCDDTTTSVGTTVSYYLDADGDGWGTSTRIDADNCLPESTAYVEDVGDCNDTLATVNPDATEVCDDNNIDENCDGLADDDAGATSGRSTWYPDDDQDGQGDHTASLTVNGAAGVKAVQACDEPTYGVAAWVTDTDDCNDLDATVLSDSSAEVVFELCDGKRNRCSDLADLDSWSSSDVPEDEIDHDGDYYVACDYHGTGEADVTWSLTDDWYTLGTGASPTQAEPEEGADCDDLDATVLDVVTYYADDDGDDYQNQTDTDADDCVASTGFEAVISGWDCDDTDASIGATVSWYTDADGDSFGDPDTAPDSDDCYANVAGAVDNAEDCDDTSVSIGNSVVYYIDIDGDGWGTTTLTDDDDCNPISSAYVSAPGDCNDGYAAVNPGATEVCDDQDVDENCDGLIDDDAGATSGRSTWYPDDDGDDQGDVLASTTDAGSAGYKAVSLCDAPGYGPASWVNTATDCHDLDSTVLSDTSAETVFELCDGKRNRCSDLADLTTWSPSDVPDDEIDWDGDYYVACDFHGDGQASVTWALTEDWYTLGTGSSPSQNQPEEGADCAPYDPSVLNTVAYYADEDGDDYQNQTDVDQDDCDPNTGYEDYGLGWDCDDTDGAVLGTVAWYSDADEDNFGDPASIPDDDDCFNDVIGGIDNDDDCDDTDASIGATVTYYLDVDGDGWGDTTRVDENDCVASSGYVVDVGDCNDAAASINPDQLEVCDENDLDENCNGLADDADAGVSAGQVDWYVDDDEDGQGDDTVAVRAACDNPTTEQDSYAGESGDCNDAYAVVMAGTGVQELCDGLLDRCDDDLDGVWSLADVPSDEVDTDGDLYVRCDFHGAGETSVVWAGAALVDGVSGESQNAPEEGRDCEEGDISVFPGAEELCDGQLNNCDDDPSPSETTLDDAPEDELDGDNDGYVACDFHQSGEESVGWQGGDLSPWYGGAVSEPYAGEDCAPEDPYTYPGAAWAEPADSGVASNCMTDTDGDGYGDIAAETPVSAGTDCDDSSDVVNPGLPETCEGVTETQVDNDCDGNTSTEGGAYVNIPNGVYTLYPDYDGDGFGCDPDLVPAGRTNNTNSGLDNCGVLLTTCEYLVGWSSNHTDCDDQDSTIHPGAEEVCNDLSDDCDADIDETADLGGESGCIDLYRDADDDGFGDDDNALCVCTTETGDYPVVDGDTYVENGGDCDDLDDNTWPGRPDEDVDGNDNDCDGRLAVFELDCDNDGALPALELEVSTYNTAEDVGLTSCDDGTTTAIVCFGLPDVELYCDHDEGDAGGDILQLLYTESDDYADYYDDGRRIYDETRPCYGGDDCDDQSAERCPDQIETCDGLDNDCSSVTVTDDDAGVPASMSSSAALAGTVVDAELDLDQDGYLACDDFDSSSAGVQTSSLGSADAVTDEALQDDCEDRCALRTPAAEELCNGFTDVCDGDREGTDRDGDGLRTCGAWGDADTSVSTEQIYVVVWYGDIDAEDPDGTGDTAAGDTASGESGATETDNSELIPLLLPRAEATICDDTLRERLEGLVGADVVAQAMGETEGSTRDPSLLLEVCSSGVGQCGVVSLNLADTSDETLMTALNEDNSEVSVAFGTDCEAAPEEWVTRTVWSYTRVIEARDTLTAYECQRMYGVDCDEVTETTPLRSGWQTSGTVPDELLDDADWYKEIGRYEPASYAVGTLGWCWGDPGDPAPGVVPAMGGDCADGDDTVSRDAVEGPSDLLGIFRGDEGDCGRCVDGLDNNCDGATDNDDPTCAVCFVGQGVGCSDKGDSGCGGSSVWIVGLGLGLAAAGRRRGVHNG